MDKETKNLLLTLALVGVGGYVLYKLLGDFFKKGQQATDKLLAPVTGPAANAYVALTTTKVKVNGTVHLPTGEYVDINDIVNAGSGIDDTGSFIWQGVKYTISNRGEDGSYEVM